MKKSSLVLIILLTAAVSSAGTIGVMKFMKNFRMGGEITIISDKRCVECNTQAVETSINKLFPEEKITVLDYSDAKGKKLYDNEKLSLLPAVLLPKRVESSESYSKISRFVTPGEKYLLLKAGGRFDPNAEICDNQKDDNGDNLVDCNDPTCKSDWTCMEKREKPDVDVFVMSHCPFGTQVEKGILPVWDLIKDKINLTIRFVDYAMHGKKEVDEQLRQYCIQEMDEKKYRQYLGCFLKEGKTDSTCLKEAGISEGDLQGCLKEADKKFNISKNFDDKTKWKGNFPPFDVDKELNTKYGVKGSPTVVINDVVAKVGRSPKELMDAICKAFKNPPEECKKQLDAASPSPGFGFNKAQAPANASCGS